MVRAYIAISIVTILWAINFTVGKLGTAEIDPLFIASFRIIVTGLLFYAFLPAEDRKIRAGDWKAILPLAVTGIAANHICFASGIKLTTPSHSAIIHALIPVFVSVVAWIVIKERMTSRSMAGMVLAVGGTLIVVLGASRTEFQGTMLGDLITTCGITAFSIYTVFGRRVMASMDSRRAVTLAFLFASPVMLPFLVWSGLRQDWSQVTMRGWSALAYMLICANMICYLLHSYALSRLRAGQVAAFTSLQPAIAIGVSILAGYAASTSLLVGSGVTLAGVVLVQLRQPTPSVE